MPPRNFKGYCPTCALAGLKTPEVCALNNQRVTSDDYCSWHHRDLQKCSICGNIILSDGIISENHLICRNCFSNLESCSVCRFSNICEFETNPSPLPKAISKQIRQGNMTAVTQVMNPERIRITCKQGCRCFDSKNGCLKQNGSCTNCEVIYND